MRRVLDGLQADGFERQLQRGGAGIDRDGVFLMQVNGEVSDESSIKPPSG
jgi:hypothetical protein